MKLPEIKKAPCVHPYPETTMFGAIAASAKRVPQAPALDFMGKITTYCEFVRKIELTAGAFIKFGIRKNDVVTICMPNTPQGVICLYALNRIGAVANILHPLSAQEEIRDHINRVKSKVLLCVNICSEKIANIIDKTSLKCVIVASPGNSMPKIMKALYALKCIKNFKYDKKLPVVDGTEALGLC